MPIVPQHLLRSTRRLACVPLVLSPSSKIPGKVGEFGSGQPDHGDVDKYDLIVNIVNNNVCVCAMCSCL